MTKGAKAAVLLKGVPPSWQNRRGHWAKSAREKKSWRERTFLQAQQARIKVHWRKPGEGSLVKVRIALRRVRELDFDNAYSSVKPVLDGLQGALIFSDAPRFCSLVVTQEHVEHFDDQETFITVERL